MKTIIFLLLSSTAFAQYNNDGQYQMRMQQGIRNDYPSMNQVYRPEPVYAPQPVYRPPTEPNYNYNFNQRRDNIYHGGGY